MINFKKITLSFIILFLLNNITFADEELNEKRFLSNVKKNWPFLAFASVPGIDDTNFLVSFQVDDSRSYISEIKCIDKFYFEILKTFKEKIKFENKSLRDLLCYSTKRALSLVRESEYFNLLSPKKIKGLGFNFLTGRIFFVDLPHPPIKPELLLEDLFTYNLKDEDIGKIVIPEIFSSDIKESKI